MTEIQIEDDYSIVLNKMILKQQQIVSIYGDQMDLRIENDDSATILSDSKPAGTCAWDFVSFYQKYQDGIIWEWSQSAIQKQNLNKLPKGFANIANKCFKVDEFNIIQILLGFIVDINNFEYIFVKYNNTNNRYSVFGLSNIKKLNLNKP